MNVIKILLPSAPALRHGAIIMNSRRILALLIAGVIFASGLSACSVRKVTEESTKETIGSSTSDSVTVETTAERIPEKHTEIVYDDGLNPEFQPGAWGNTTYDIAYSWTDFSEDSAIYAKCGPWEAFELFRRSEDWSEYYDMYPNQYESITFSFNSGTDLADDMNLSFSIDKGAEVKVVDYLPFDPSPETSYKVTIPLRDVNADGGTILRLVFFNSGENVSEFFLEDVVLNWTDDFTAPVILDPQISVGSAETLATIKFKTDELCSASFEYGIGEYSEKIQLEDFVSERKFTISDLERGGQYMFRIIASDHQIDPEAEANATILEGTFTAAAPTEFDEQVVFAINAADIRGEISPYIYGANFSDVAAFGEVPYPFARIGGNRWTAYNWENNASNAGSDWYYHNDAYLGDTTEPAGVVIDAVTEMFGYGATALITIPIQGYVAADKDGTDVTETSDYLNTRFKTNSAFKKAPLEAAPDLTDNYVYQDEFVSVLENAFAQQITDSGLDIFYSLDNEPDLWASTHSPIQPEPVGYDELIEKNIEYARAIKSVAADAVIFGFVSYGYNGFINLQEAPGDYEAHGEFIDYYLSELAAAEVEYDERLVDVLDLHWYPEASFEGTRIGSDESGTGLAEARMQSPRSLWDPTYVEDSWITDYNGGKGIALIPWLREKIDRCYPGTEIAFTEYYYGGGDDISGAITQADVLGIFGREDIFAASYWHTGDSTDAYIHAAFNMFLNVDGQGNGFGDTSIAADNTDTVKTSVYASLDSQDPNKMVIMAINKSDEWIEAQINISANGKKYTTATVYQLTSASSQIIRLDDRKIDDDQLVLPMDPLSVTCIVLSGE